MKRSCFADSLLASSWSTGFVNKIMLGCFFLITVMVSVASAFSEEQIRCKVCHRAIQHVWNKGVELRTHCRNRGADPRCQVTNVHNSAVENMVHGVCDDLPRTHQALEHSEFDMVLHEDPKHSDELASLITRVCKDWVHEEHGVENVARMIFANLDAGKSTGTILHALEHRYCKKACSTAKKRKRDFHDDL